MAAYVQNYEHSLSSGHGGSMWYPLIEEKLLGFEGQLHGGNAMVAMMHV